MPKKYPHKVSELPDKSFFAILTETRVTIPGDERSRTCPGHGYPEHTESFWNMEVYENEKEWKEEVKRLTMSRDVYGREFKAVCITPAKIDVSVDIGVSLESLPLKESVPLKHPIDEKKVF